MQLYVLLTYWKQGFWSYAFRNSDKESYEKLFESILTSSGWSCMSTVRSLSLSMCTNLSP